MILTLVVSFSGSAGELSFIDLMDSQHLALDANRAYVATTGMGGNGWIDVVDIDDPVNPRQIDHRGDLGMGVQALATAWPTIATSNVDIGLEILSLHRSCIPPRHPSDRVAP